MKFFNGAEITLGNYSQAYQRRFLQQEVYLLRESGIRLTNGLGFLFDNIALREQPCFSSFNNFTDFTTDLQALIAKPLICLWLASVHALRVELEFGICFLRLPGLSIGIGVNTSHHVPEMIASMVASVCYSLRKEA